MSRVTIHSPIGIKKERIHNQVHHTRDKARAEISNYIEVFYSSTRRHYHLEGMRPEAFEEVWCKQAQVSTKLWAVYLMFDFLKYE